MYLNVIKKGRTILITFKKPKYRFDETFYN